MNVEHVWSTSDAESLILKMARVSSTNQDSSDTRLLKYLLNHKHYSPFEMAYMCVKIETSRAVAPQLLRHRSFTFQEFSQRYAEVEEFEVYPARRQDKQNKQNSIDDLSEEVKSWFVQQQDLQGQHSMWLYKKALELGVAKECARALLPLTAKTKLYMCGSLRSWIHYFDLRCDVATQLEHREIANKIKEVFVDQFPVIGEITNGN